MTRPSVSSTWALVLTFNPPKVKQFAHMIGKARNGGVSIGRAQLVFSGTSPRVVRPSSVNGVKVAAGGGHAALYAATAASSAGAGRPTWAARPASVGAS